jgi:arginase
LKQFSVIDSPSILGLRPTGVECLPDALKAAGLMSRLNAEYAGHVSPLSYNSERDKETLLLNADSIREFSQRLADKVTHVMDNNRQFPIVLGGDCSILIGALLGLRLRNGRYGLFFIDGHADFYQPNASPTGEVADMDLAIVSGRGPDILTNIDGLKPLILDQHIVVFGYRDAVQAASYGSQDVRHTNMHVFDLFQVQTLGVANAASQAVKRLLKHEIIGFWIHLDVDVLNDQIMPAVDYRLGGGGLSFSELSDLLKILFGSGRAIGMDITIFNPSKDGDGSIARNLVSSLVAGITYNNDRIIH